MSLGNIPPIDQSLLPASIRNGTPAQKQAYSSALGFEQMLVDQLSQELAASSQADPSSADSGDGSNSSDTASGSLLGGSDPATSMYGQMLPTALSSGIMAAGGIGIAQQLATSIDPAAFAGKAKSP